MSNTVFVDQSTIVVAAWLNDINNVVYNLLGNGTIVPATVAALRTNIGLGTMATQNASAVAITGGTLSGVTISGVAASGTNTDITALNALATVNSNTVVGIYNHGQCLLAKSGSNLVLSPYNGNRLIINGVQQVVPNAGVTLAPTGLSATTLYYIYAYMVSTTMTLEASTTTHARDTTTGVEIKSGDATRTLVGMAYVKTAATFADSATQRFVRSWFNETGVGLQNQLPGNVGYATNAFAEISAGIRCEFVSWTGEAIIYQLSGTTSNNGINNNTYTGVGFDAGNNPEYGMNLTSTYAAGVGLPVAVSGIKIGLTEGYHFATMSGKPDAGTSTWTGTTSAWGMNLSLYIKK